ncbi:putative sulfate exporter family transporter, partial [Prauserella sp. ASG 168]|nr:putative sulfate exporter family transporter [Prauserella cavernicola]
APAGTEPSDTSRATVAWTLAGLVVVLGLAALTRFLEQNDPDWSEGTALGEFAAGVEVPVYAIILGLLGNLVLSRAGVRDRLAAAFRTEYFIKTGLV